MAQELQSISLLAPAFRGLNTQESPLQMDPSFATVADNCVIDKSGRLASRKGVTVDTTDATPLGSSSIKAIREFIDNAGASTVLSAGNNKLFSGTTTLTDITPAAYTPTGDDWQILSFNNAAYFFQRGHEPLQYASGTLQTFTAAGATGTPPQGNAALAAYGRLWVADVANDKYTLYWSDLLNGLAWTAGSSGSINLRTVWPRGYDEVVGMAAHNDFLIIFGKESILIYSGAEDPATMQLADTIVDIGCVSRDSIKVIGTDVLFLSQEGVRSLGRTIQEKSSPIGDISANIKDDIVDLIASSPSGISATFSPEDNLYLVSFPDIGIVYAFDTRTRLENGAMRATRWPTSEHTAYFTTRDGTLYIGDSNGIGRYAGYLDNGQTYVIEFESPQLAFGDDTRLKFLKRVRTVVSGGGGVQASLRWRYDFSDAFYSRSFTLSSPTGETAEFGESEYGIGEYSASSQASTIRANINGSGSGTLLQLGFSATVNGYEVGIQSINLQTLLGKLI